MTLEEEINIYHHVLETHNSAYVVRLQKEMEADMKKRYELTDKAFNDLYNAFIQKRNPYEKRN